MAKTRLINQETIRNMVDMHDIIGIVHDLFVEMGNGNVKNPAKVSLDMGQNDDWPDYDGFFNAMPAYIGGNFEVAGIKWVSGFGGARAEAGLPYINGMILIADPKMGSFKAVMDGAYITNMRTGAQSVVALQSLGYKEGDKINLSIFGTGMQAKTQLLAMADYFDIEDFRFWNYKVDDPAVPEYKEFAEKVLGFEPKFCPEHKEAAKADIVITVTNAPEPYLELEHLHPGTILLPLGSKPEIKDEVISHADHLIVDHKEQTLHRGALETAAKKGLVSEDDIEATIGELLAGKAETPELKDDDITLLIPIGMGSLDIAVAGTVAKKAEEKDLGEIFEFQPY